MTKITVTKIVNTKPDQYGKISVRVKTKEFGEKEIFMMTVKDVNSIKEGGVYEGEHELWKEFEDGTKWNSWTWPKKEDIAAGEISALKTTVAKLNFKVEELEICIKGLCHKLGIDIKDLRTLADEAARGYKYPVNNLPEATFENYFTPTASTAVDEVSSLQQLADEIDSRDIPF